MENPVILLFLILGVIIIAARLGAATARALNQPRVLGELVVGVLLGPTILDLLHTTAFGIDQAHLQETIIELAELGVLLLMFKVGLEVHVSELAKVGGVAVLAGVLGAILPVAMTLPLYLVFDFTWQECLFAGVTMAATSVSISAQVLLELNVLHTKEGNALLATALVDDVIAILLISITLAITGPQTEVNAGEFISIFVRMAAFIGISSAVAWFGLPKLMTLIERRYELAEAYGMAAFALVLALLFGWAAEEFGGVAAITGAFIAGVGLSRTYGGVRREIEAAVSNIAYAFLVPIFFVSVGLQIDLSTFPLETLPFALLLLLIAVLSKVIGCWFGARLGGFNNLEAARVGICMISRGEVGLIIASIGISSGVFSIDDPLFASLFLVILMTTILTPPFVRFAFEMGKDGSDFDMQQVGEKYGEARVTDHASD
jgi:Kef-type K+ transport system membrane component KefB